MTKPPNMLQRRASRSIEFKNIMMGNPLGGQ
jgi:hypothetical protein